MKHFITKTGLLLISFLLCLQISPSLADTVYRSTDNQGRITYSSINSPGATPLQLAARPARERHRVFRVVDGDTIELYNHKRVRLLGINAPEIESRYRPAEPGAKEAKAWLYRKLRGRYIYLEYDREKKDRYKRELAHIFMPDGEHVNLSMVEQGLVTVTLLPPNLSHADVMIKAQQRAETKKLGIWALRHYQPRQLIRLTKKPFGWQRYLTKITAIKRNQKNTRLIVNANTDILIANKNLTLFPPLENYLNKPVEVRGWVSRRKKHFTIRVHHPSALILR